MDELKIKDRIRQEIKLLAFKTVTDKESLLSSKLLDSINVVDLAGSVPVIV